LASRIANFVQWRSHTRHRIERQWKRTGDPALIDLLDEMSRYPVPAGADSPESPDSLDDAALARGIVVPLRVRTDQGLLSFPYTTSLFGAPHAVTLVEIAIESFFPADAATAGKLRRGPRDVPE
jgi:hypothetical protein